MRNSGNGISTDLDHVTKAKTIKRKTEKHGLNDTNPYKNKTIEASPSKQSTLALTPYAPHTGQATGAGLTTLISPRASSHQTSA